VLNGSGKAILAEDDRSRLVVQVALGAVTKNIKLAGYNNPLHKPRTTNYYVVLALQTESCCQTDPIIQKQLAVPVGIPNHLFLESHISLDQQTKAIGKLAIMIAFYFLLHIGEYIYHGQAKHCMQLFHLQDLKKYEKDLKIAPQQFQ